MKTIDRLAYTPTEAAIAASTSRPTIYRWMHMDGFPVARIGGCTRIPVYTVTPTLGMTQKNQPKIRYTLDFDVTPHQLRHTYITNLLYAGVDPKTVQYLAGHENSKTTMDIYAKVKYNKPEELFGVVNGAFHQAPAQ